MSKLASWLGADLPDAVAEWHVRVLKLAVLLYTLFFGLWFVIEGALRQVVGGLIVASALVAVVVAYSLGSGSGFVFEWLR